MKVFFFIDKLPIINRKDNSPKPGDPIPNRKIDMIDNIHNHDNMDVDEDGKEEEKKKEGEKEEKSEKMDVEDKKMEVEEKEGVEERSQVFYGNNAFYIMFRLLQVSLQASYCIHIAMSY